MRWPIAAVVGVAVTAGITSGAAAAPVTDPGSGTAITTRVFDRATGEPVKGVCVLALPVPTFSLPKACPARSGGGGRVTVQVPGPGQYNLFALPKLDSPYGAQWVGPDGGTGRQQQARRVTLAAGETKRVAQVLLDPRATISGWTHPRELPGVVSIAAPDPDVANDPRTTPIRPDGTFDIDWVGPYEWPVLLRLDGEAIQWSGGVGNRLIAETVRAVPGGSADRYEFHPGYTEARLFVQMANGAPPCPDLRVFYRNVATRDVMGGTGLTSLLAGGQQIKIEYQCAGETRWYGGTDFDSATPVVVKYFAWLRVYLP
ncbi:hypothetical protein O7623_03885 [Solwaraspora sp. WMMD791]|uniref:hypothetical protein n=1 Tax=Solwaraspora sp. WMMD791 TaxID=3016086 RepID=UPI00249AE485|nr:hypothetical protein [Solwaraspora sp. WMMD791]WFE28364.1 hypothetical protein O7623_03885 [Solwaraspora sp. WMMD791]